MARYLVSAYHAFVLPKNSCKAEALGRSEQHWQAGVEVEEGVAHGSTPSSEDVPCGACCRTSSPRAQDIVMVDGPFTPVGGQSTLFAVPQDRWFVLTSLDVPTYLELIVMRGGQEISRSRPANMSFAFPLGRVFEPGTELQIRLSAQDLEISLRGYLTDA